MRNKTLFKRLMFMVIFDLPMLIVLNSRDMGFFPMFVTNIVYLILLSIAYELLQP